MDAQRFDAWTRRLRSRRSVLAGLAGGLAAITHRVTADDVGAKSCSQGKKRCGKRCIAKRVPCCPPSKKRCGERCIPKRTPCCKADLKACGTRCIAKSICCTHADCGERRLCVNGICIIGQGTCAAGRNACLGVNPTTMCNRTASPLCYCVQSTTGQTRCGHFALSVTCGECLDDADCARIHPSAPGAFCMQSDTTCGCVGSTYCVAPCPE
jgi:hypothetical protein